MILFSKFIFQFFNIRNKIFLASYKKIQINPTNKRKKNILFFFPKLFISITFFLVIFFFETSIIISNKILLNFFFLKIIIDSLIYTMLKDPLGNKLLNKY